MIYAVFMRLIVWRFELVPVNIVKEPNVIEPKMKTIYHPSESRGSADLGWLQSRHTFSFASYFNPDRIHFGALRVLNDDIVAPGKGFGMHRHDNMEIVSIPLEGDLEHKDSMGNTAVIKQGDIQVMSAGTGIFHSEYNKNGGKEVKFLQIWVLPNKKNVPPRYDQIHINPELLKNRLVQVLSPHPDDDGVWIHQNAWFHMSHFEAGHAITYQLKNYVDNGLYIFVIEGEIHAANQPLKGRDGLGIWDVQDIVIESTTEARVLLMEVPMMAP